MSNKPLENLFNELEDLNRKIIELCCNHRRYADKIPDDLNDYMAKAAYTEYVQQHEIHLEKLTAAAETELYNIKTIAAMSTPEKHRRWYWPWSVKRNYAAQCVDAKFAEYTQTFIDQILAQGKEIKDEFCNAWARLFQQDPPDGATEPDAPVTEDNAPDTPLEQPPEDAAPASDMPPAQEPTETDNAETDNAASPATGPADTETWEEWEEPNDPITDKDIASPSEG